MSRAVADRACACGHRPAAHDAHGCLACDCGVGAFLLDADDDQGVGP